MRGKKWGPVRVLIHRYRGNRGFFISNDLPATGHSRDVKVHLDSTWTLINSNKKVHKAEADITDGRQREEDCMWAVWKVFNDWRSRWQLVRCLSKLSCSWECWPITFDCSYELPFGNYSLVCSCLSLLVLLTVLVRWYPGENSLWKKQRAWLYLVKLLPHIMSQFMENISILATASGKYCQGLWIYSVT